VVKEEKMMSHCRMNRLLPILAALVLSMPIAAARANDSKPIVTDTVVLLNPVTLAGTHLPAGTYSVKAGDSKVTILAGGKVVAEAPVEWKDEQSKPRLSAIVTASGRVTEIHFGGKMRYIAIAG
jgi:hypothetical protein